MCGRVGRPRAGRTHPTAHNETPKATMTRRKPSTDAQALDMTPKPST
jgi:hypothetical protein